jgi:hypothetical protein
MNMADNYRGQRFKPETDPDNYAAIAAALKQERENSRLCGPGYEEINAPTSGKGRPRAQKCCYNKTTETLVIVMSDWQRGGRMKLTWIQYDDVTEDMWAELKDADSTNDFITSTLYGWPWIETYFNTLPRTRDEAFKDAAAAFENYETRYKEGYTY